MRAATIIGLSSVTCLPLSMFRSLGSLAAFSSFSLWGLIVVVVGIITRSMQVCFGQQIRDMHVRALQMQRVD